MNFKIERNFLDLTNYPSIEKHFEKRASEGWMISKIIVGTLFIYRRIEPQLFDFSITPYEIESFFNRKTKSEIEEFQAVSEKVGWHYQTKSSDLHIYYKEKDKEAPPIQTNDEDEFVFLESIGQKTITGYWILLGITFFTSFFIYYNIFDSSYSMKNGGTQITALLLPLGFLLSLWGLVQMHQFLKKNRVNIELGRSLEFSKSHFYFVRILSTVIYALVFLFMLYSIYLAFILKNIRYIIAFIPLVIGLIFGNLYSYFVKAQKKSSHFKKITFGLMLVVVIFLAAGINLDTLSSWTEDKLGKDLSEYKMLRMNDFDDIEALEEGILTDQTSFLVPKSYDYYFYALDEQTGITVSTDYGQALTDKLAKKLLQNYTEEAVQAVSGEYNHEILEYLDQGEFDQNILKTGLTEADLIALKELPIDQAEEKAQEIIIERSILPANEALWNVDEVYYLNYEKSRLVIRKGKEVFHLRGRNFSDPFTVDITKKALHLN